jgi:tRNA modification GTPase
MDEGAEMLDDGRTIVAQATPTGRGGVAVVRLSGPDAVAIARRIVPGRALAEPVASHRARLATVVAPGNDADGGGRALDEVLVLPMLAPRSYTGEDTIEFSCHGGSMPARLVVDACLAAGARAATAGEFTRRAFLNGRLSLTEAEAVADLIASEHATGARAALSQLRGGLTRRLAIVEDPLRDLLAQLEGSLEFGEEAGMEPDRSEVAATLAAAAASIDDLLALVPAGRWLRDGVQVVLTGAPNAGKSSLFNALVGDDRVIVDETPGTTRDAVASVEEWEGVRVVLHDTAGVREHGDRIESKGMARTRERIANADVVLALVPADGSAARLPLEVPDSATVIEVVTKGDLAAADAMGQDEDESSGTATMITSSVTGAGLDRLRDAVVSVARDARLEEAASAGIVLNQRHQARLIAVRDGLATLRGVVDDEAGDEVIASLLGAVLQDLGSVSGRVFTERLLGEVFHRFCVGK